MVGDAVGGYEVKESLGSGRSGLLFLAVQSTGHRAVVRRRLGDDDVHEFAREAAQALQLPTPPMVERRKSRAGVAVLLAIVDPDAPGTGYTDHPNTVPLQRVSASSRSSSNRSMRLVWVSIVAAMVGSVGAVASLSARGAPAAEVHVARVAPTPVKPTDAPTVERAEFRPPALPVAQVVGEAGPQTQPPPVVSPEKPAARPHAASPSTTTSCTPDDEWKRARYADLQDLFALASRTDTLSSAWDRPLTGLEREVHRATTLKDCAAIEKRLQGYLKRLRDSSVP